MHRVDLGESFLLFETDSYSNEYLLAKFGFDTAENEPDLIHVVLPSRDLILPYVSHPR